jgi:hypothetical protein
MNPLFEAALDYAKRGWLVLPIVPGAKNPLVEHGVHDATIDPEILKAWWTKWPTASVAVACGEKSGITVIDIDEEADEWLAKLPKTLTQTTPGGGYHAIYNYHAAIRNTIRPHSGIDFRNDGGYILLAPSACIDGSFYRWLCGSEFTTLAEFPDWLIPTGTSCAMGSSCLALTSQPEDVLNRASLYLAACDPAIQGCGGHNKLLYAADRMVNGFLLTDQQAYDILAKEFNPRCVPPWNLTDQKDERDFRRKISEARRLGGQREPGWLLASSTEDTRSCLPLLQLLKQRASDPNENQLAAWTTSTGELPICGGSSGGNAPISRQNELSCPQQLVNPPGLLGEICQWMNETALIQQPLLSLGATLTFLGAILGRKVKDTLGSRTNLYCMGVAPSSAGKNHAITCIRNLCAEALCTQLLGGEYVASDAAIEERMAKSPATLFLWDEIGYLLSHIRSGVSKNHAQVISMLMRLYSSASSMYLGREYADKDRQRVIIQPCCCIYGTATPESFACGLSPDQLQDGWLSRCLVFYSRDRPEKQRNLGSSSTIPPNIVERVKQLYEWKPEWPNESAIRQHVMPDRDGAYQEKPPYQILIPETKEATEIFRNFDDETVKLGDKNPQLACLWKKGEENARRIALILSASSSGTACTDSGIADYSCLLVRYLLNAFIENIVPEISENEIAKRKQKIIRLIQESKKGITRQELTKRTRWVTGGDRAKLLDDIISSGEVKMSLTPDGPVFTIE